MTIQAGASASAARLRVLFIAEAVTLAHVARVHALAAMLDPEVFEICVASDRRYEVLTGPHSFESHTVATISGARFAAAIAKGRPIYDLQTLLEYVEDDHRIIADFKPDVIIGDFRLSLGVSARLAQIPFVNVTNAGWSPYTRIKFTVPDIEIARRFGASAAQVVFDIARPFAFAMHSLPINRLRKRFGLRRLPFDLRSAYCDGDYTVYADIAELFAVDSLPPNHSFMGPILWSPAIGAPAWWSELPSDRPIVYVTMGSSGPSTLLPLILEILGKLPVTVVAATAGRMPFDRFPTNAFVEKYLQGSLVTACANLVICNGGSPTCYQAFSEGIPVIGIASNLDQYLNMRAVESAEAGILIRPEALARHLAASVRVGLNGAPFARGARKLRTAIERYRPSINFTNILLTACQHRVPPLRE